MNINYLETFLDVMETRNFNRSAERLNITQSTVSARIRALEDAVRSPLFHRGRFGAEPTAAGFKFLPHASRLRQIWNQARQELALPEGMAASVRLATQPSLRDAFVKDWLAAMRDNHPDIAVYLEADYSPSVLQQLSDGTLDIGIIYIPRALPGLLVERLFSEHYRMIGAVEMDIDEVTAEDYVFIDWSPHFKNRHLELLPHLQATAVSVGLGSMAVDHILERKGCGYFPGRTAELLIERHGCHPVRGAPEIEQPVYVVVAERVRDTGPVRIALDELNRIAGQLSA